MSQTATIDALKNRLAYQPVSLGIIALLASAALTLAYNATKEHIAAAAERDMQMSLAQVLPAGLADNDLLADTRDMTDANGKTIKVHVAKQAGSATGAVFQMARRGYAGEIVVLMAVDKNGRVLGVRVLKHVETPGLGDKIDVAKSDWIKGFEGHSLGNPAAHQWAVKKDNGIFDQFAGATITPRAVVQAVKDGLEFFAQHRNVILAGDPS